RPSILYAACGAAAFSTTLASNRLAPDLPFLRPHTGALDLIPFAVLTLTGGLALRSRRAWADPLLNSAGAACILGLAAAIALGCYGALGLTGAAGTREDMPPYVPQAWATGALIASAAAAAFAGAWAALGLRLDSRLSSGMALAAWSWLAYAATWAARRKEED